MAIQRNRWRPDTCGCVLVYEWDDSLPEDQRVHTGAVIEKACLVHAAVADPKAHYVAIVAENQSKNVAVNAVAISLGWVPPVDDGLGLASDDDRHPFAPHRIPWSFDGDRDLVIDSAKLVARGAQAGDVAVALSEAQAAVTASRAVK